MGGLRVTAAQIDAARKAGACDDGLAKVAAGMRVDSVAQDLLIWAEETIPDAIPGGFPAPLWALSRSGDGYGDGGGYGGGYGSGSSGYGYGYGSSGYGYGYGYGSGSSGYGYGYGYGYGSGSYGYGSGSSGYGYGRERSGPTLSNG